MQTAASVFQAFGATDRGRFRHTNEDCFHIDARRRLCVVADGLGGHRAGEVAARVAVDTVVEWMGDARSWPFGYDGALSEAGNRLRTAIQLANLQVLEVAGTSSRYSGMGTTIVAAMVVGRTLAVAHAGDSRLYLFSHRHLRQLTADDTWIAAVLADDPGADSLLRRCHPMRHAVTNVVGTRPAPDVHVVEEPLFGGELLALTTDGVHGVLEDEEIARILRGPEDAAMPRELIRAALAGGSDDNCTAVVGRFVAE
jgi:protein phosphatase